MGVHCLRCSLSVMVRVCVQNGLVFGSSLLVINIALRGSEQISFRILPRGLESTD